MSCKPADRQLVVRFPHLDKGGASGMRTYQVRQLRMAGQGSMAAAPRAGWQTVSCCQGKEPFPAGAVPTPQLGYGDYTTQLLPRFAAFLFQGVELSQLELAYAITVHKAQGGEAAHVVLALSREHGRMLTRRLLYTGACSVNWDGVMRRAQRLGSIPACRLCSSGAGMGSPQGLMHIVQASRRSHTHPAHPTLSQTPGLTRAKQQLVVVSAGGEAGADPLAQAVRRKDNESRLTSLQVTLGWRGERLSSWAVGLLGCPLQVPSMC